MAAADLLPAGSNITNAIGDAFAIKGTGRGGHDRLIGNVSLYRLTGDAVEMRGHAIGGNDFLSGNGGADDLSATPARWQATPVAATIPCPAA